MQKSLLLKKEIRKVVKSTENQKQRNQTLKWFDGSLSGNLTTASTFAVWTNLSPGTGNLQRIGNKIHILGLSIRGSFVLGDTTNVIRMLFFKWNMNNNSDTPSASEVLSETTDPMSNIVPLKPSRFKILHDSFYQLDTSHVVRTFHEEVKLDYDITYDPTTNNGIGQVYSLLISDSAAVPHPTYDLNVQVRYIDSN
jgi:hypothetical protein